VDDEDSAAVREVRATFMPAEGERPEWEEDDAVQVLDDEVCVCECALQAPCTLHTHSPGLPPTPTTSRG
jgi:hypothetical protein